MSNEEAIEVCLDADRLITFDSQATNDMVRELAKQHGRRAVIEKLAERIYLV